MTRSTEINASRTLIHVTAILLCYVLICCHPYSATNSRIIEFYIDEQPNLGFTVGSVRQQYERLQVHGSQTFNTTQLPIRFSIVEGSSYFKLNPSTGMLSVAATIDRDRMCDQRVKSCCSTKPGQCHIQFSVQMTGKQSFFQLVQVRVYVADLNDNKPVWIKRRIRVYAMEESLTQAPLEISAAQDRDLGVNGTLTYKLHDPTGTFAVLQPSSSPSELQLKILKRLDRETKSLYKMNLTAIDGRPGGVRLQGSVEIIVDIVDTNDHSPVFDKTGDYVVTVPESLQINELVLRVHATDKDYGDNAEIKYSYSPSTQEIVKRTFLLNRSNGQITLQSKLDYESQQEYTFSVVASDQSQIKRKSTKQVHIRVRDENDCAPYFTVYSTKEEQETVRVSVPENAAKDHTLAVISVSDCDYGPAGRSTCVLSDNESHRGRERAREFKLEPVDSQGKQLLLKSAIKFDRERKALYRLNIRCSDRGVPAKTTEKNLQVRIEDVNDEPPVFSQSSYSFKIREDVIGQEFAVPATDADFRLNSRIKYRLIPRPNNSTPSRHQVINRISEHEIERLFKIDNNKAAFRNLEPLDRERQSRVDFAVVATDGGSPPLSSTALITVVVEDINDNAPQFNESKYAFHLVENSPAGMVVGKVSAFDKDTGDNARLRFHIDKQRGIIIPFSINRVSNNSATIITNRKIDRERVVTQRNQFTCTHSNTARSDEAFFCFQVVVTDGNGKSDRVEVIVWILDANDIPPKWVFPGNINHSVNLSRFADVGHKVAIVKAMDKDFGEHAILRYYIISGDPKQLFILDPESGHLQIRRAIGESDKSTYNLLLKVEDNPNGFKNETLSANTMLRIFLTHTGGLRGGPGGHVVGGRPRIGRGGTERSWRIILVLVVSTAVIAFILILIIVLARLLMIRRPRPPAKSEALRHGPSMSHLGSNTGGPAGYPTIYSTQNKSASGHVISSDANGNKHETVYYSAEALDRDEPPSMNCQHLSKSEIQSHMTESTTIGGYKGSNSIEGLCDLNRSWLTATNTRPSSANQNSVYADARYNELNVRDYTSLNAHPRDDLGHYYDLVRTSEENQSNNKNRANTLRSGQHQPIINVNTLRGRSFIQFDKKASTTSPSGTAREGSKTLEELSELPPLLGNGHGGDPGDGETDNCVDTTMGKSLHDLTSGYRMRAKQSPYQASFV